ncbi:hypothetical protein GCM10010345_19650 [Streptomyces canarius]|uniref:Uncharacterized protein n=1 Tax=Streptomyces canarius TaxID=285453 RepID=A0ABQ3CIE6_9ACTN|nr:hypothetical protein GCM10010345_19650 [Streptomyces canarius]
MSVRHRPTSPQLRRSVHLKVRNQPSAPVSEQAGRPAGTAIAGRSEDGMVVGRELSAIRLRVFPSETEGPGEDRRSAGVALR